MKIALVRGAFLTPSDIQLYTPLAERHDLSVIGADWQLLYQHAFHDARVHLHEAPVWLGWTRRFGDKVPGHFNRLSSWTLGQSFGLRQLDPLIGKPDVLESAETFFTMTYQCLQLKEQLGCALVVTVRENIPHMGEAHPLRKFRKRLVLEGADRLIAITPTTRAMLLEEGVPEDKIALVPLAIDTERFSYGAKDPALMARLGLKKDDIVVLFVGRFVPEKGIEDLLQAVAETSASAPDVPLRFCFVGSGSLLSRLKEAQKQYGQKIVICPPIEYSEVPKFQRLADIFVLPSRPAAKVAEQFGFALVESMACRKAVIATRVGSLPDVLDDAGILLPDKSPGVLAKTILRLARSPEERESLGHKAEQRARDLYDAKNNARKLEAVYAEAIDVSKARLKTAPAWHPSTDMIGKHNLKVFGFKVSGEAGVRLLATIFILLLARHVGVSEFGRYSSAFAFAALFCIFVDLGTSPIVTREVAREPDRRSRIVNATNLLKLCATLVSWAILHTCARIFPMSRDKVPLIDALGIVVFGYSLTDHFSALLAGKEEMGWEAILKVVSRTLALSGAFVALLMHKSLTTIVSAMAAGTVLSYAGCALIIRARFKVFSYEFDGPFLKKLMRSCAPVFAAIFFWVLYENQDILLLTHFALPNHDIGLFSAAMKIIDVLRVFPVLLMGVYFPSLVRISLGPREPFIHRTRALLGLMVAGSLLITAAAMPTATVLIRLFYGPGYAAAAPTLRLLLLAFVFVCLNHTLQQLTIAKDLEGKLLAGAIIACLSNLASAWFMIQRYGVPGVCYALICSEILYLSFQIWTIYRFEPEIMKW